MMFRVFMSTYDDPQKMIWLYNRERELGICNTSKPLWVEADSLEQAFEKYCETDEYWEFNNANLNGLRRGSIEYHGYYDDGQRNSVRYF